MNQIIAFGVDAISDANLRIWTGLNDGIVNRISNFAIHPKKWKNGALEEVKMTTNNYASVIRLNGFNSTHYYFRIDLTSLLGLSYMDKKMMNTGLNFKLRKDLFDQSFHSAIDTWFENFKQFCAWRAKPEVWASLYPFQSAAIKKLYPEDKPPGLYFNKDTAFNGTSLSMSKLKATGIELPSWINDQFIISCITPAFIADALALGYKEVTSTIKTRTGENLEIVQKEPTALDYKALRVQTFGGGGNDVSDVRGTADLWSMVTEEPAGEDLAPSNVRPTIIEVNGETLTLQADGSYK